MNLRDYLIMECNINSKLIQNHYPTLSNKTQSISEMNVAMIPQLPLHHNQGHW